MRLWHKDLIPYLPKKQLLGQWRECCCIAKNMKEKGTPNHLLVNKILNYPESHFNSYAEMVAYEMWARGYECDWNKFLQHRVNRARWDDDSIFDGWHNDRYLVQCLYNLQEKLDCGGIKQSEWDELMSHFNVYLCGY